MSEPSLLSIPEFFKASPHTEGGRRFVYLEASNEALDLQNETVLAKALQASGDYFLQYGNLDIDHITQIGRKAGIPDYEHYEIGRPIEVKANGSQTFVKGEIFQGEGPMAEKANRFWESITALDPPQRWYPSVGGTVLAKSTALDTKTQVKKSLVTEVRWTNVGFSKTPVNPDVPTVSSVPFGVLKKCWGPEGLDLAKALTAGYGSDSQSLTGGGALRQQSLEGVPLNYFDFRDCLADAMLSKKITNPTAKTLTAFAVKTWGFEQDDAAKWVIRFLHDLKQDLTNQGVTP